MSDLLFRPKLLYRKRIKKIFENIFNYPLSVVVASIGYGKTIAVHHFLDRKKDINQVWLSLGTNEIDSTWIWYKLCSVIHDSNNILAKKLTEAGPPKSDVDIEFIINIIEENINSLSVFILDNFNCVEGNYLNKLIEAFAYRSIPNLHIVVISRQYPNFNYNKLILKGYCYMINQQDISFDTNEITEFFKLNSYILDNDKKSILLNYIDGWVSGIYLSLLCYSQYGNFDNIEDLNLFIKTGVYDKFDDITKYILMKISLLENFTLPQAVFISKNKKATIIIKKIAENNCFIKYDSKYGIYKLHTMLKSVTFEALEESNIDMKELFNLCGDWYFQNKDIITSISYYNNAQNYECILSALEEFSGNILHLAPTIILGIFNNITLEQKLKHPLAYIFFINYYITNVNFERGAAMLYEAKWAYENIYDFTNKNKILGEVAIIEAIIHFYNIIDVMKYLKRAYKLFDGAISKISYNEIIFTLGSPHTLYPYHIKEGTLLSTIRLFEDDITYYTQVINCMHIGYEYLARAEYCYETGDIETAEFFAYKAILKAKSKNQINLVISSLFTLMRIAILNSKKDDLLDYINELVQDVKNESNSIVTTNFELSIGDIYACIGKIDKIPKWICNCEYSHCNTLIQNIGGVDFTYGKILCRKQNFVELEILVEVMIEKSMKNNHIFTKIVANIFDSIAKYNLYDIEKAKVPLINAIKLASFDNIIMPFAENAKYIMPILSNIDNDYSNRILIMCQKFNDGINKINNITITNLTKRETEIINLVSEGYKNIEISKTLGIAPVTVEKMLSSIYKKLGVKNRVSAVTKIKDLSKYKNI